MVDHGYRCFFGNIHGKIINWILYVYKIPIIYLYKYWDFIIKNCYIFCLLENTAVFFYIFIAMKEYSKIYDRLSSF